MSHLVIVWKHEAIDFCILHAISFKALKSDINSADLF